MHIVRTILLIVISFFVIGSQSVFAETNTHTVKVNGLGLTEQEVMDAYIYLITHKLPQPYRKSIL